MTSVNDILQAKGTTTFSIAPSAPVSEALTMMTDHDIGALTVIQNGQLVGLFTERDFARHASGRGDFSLAVPVGEMMSHDVLYVAPDTTLEECMALMTEKRTRHFPVLASGKLAGLVSIGDIIKKLLGEKDLMIEQLERYITGTY